MKYCWPKVGYTFITIFLLIAVCQSCLLKEPAKSRYFEYTDIFVRPVEYFIKGDSLLHINKYPSDATRFDTGKLGFEMQLSVGPADIADSFADFYSSLVVFPEHLHYFDPVDTISKIDIFSVLDFDKKQAAFSNITSYFSYFTHQNTDGKYYKTRAIHHQIQPDLQAVGAFIPERADIDYYFHLDRMPSLSSNVQFRFEVHFTNGKVLSSTTDLITIRCPEKSDY